MFKLPILSSVNSFLKTWYFNFLPYIVFQVCCGSFRIIV